MCSVGIAWGRLKKKDRGRRGNNGEEAYLLMPLLLSPLSGGYKVDAAASAAIEVVAAAAVTINDKGRRGGEWGESETSASLFLAITKKMENCVHVS